MQMDMLNLCWKPIGSYIWNKDSLEQTEQTVQRNRREEGCPHQP